MATGAAAASGDVRGVVEIIEPHDRAFFRATLIDIDVKKQKYLVRYLGEEETCWVDMPRLRALPAQMTPVEWQRWNPREGETIEVCFADDGEATSESWWEGTLQKKKGEFYFVTFPDSGGSGQSSEVVEKERLRPAYGMAPVKFEKKNFPIDPRIRPDVKATQDSLPKVGKLANLIALNLSQDGASLVAIGPQSALDTAGALIDMHMMKVPQLAKVAKTANALQGRMMGVQETMNRGVMEQFRVDVNSIGMIVGKNGANIKKAQALAGVHRIDIRQDGMISIVADTPQAGKEARAMLEVTQEKIKIQSHEVGLVIGRGGKQINDLEMISSCRINVQAGTETVTITGLKSSVEKAKALLAYTIETFNEQREKEQQIQSLSKELYQLGVPLAGEQQGYYGQGMPMYGQNRGRGRGGQAMPRGAPMGMVAPRGGMGGVVPMPNPNMARGGARGGSRGGGAVQARGGGAVQARGGGAVQARGGGAIQVQVGPGGQRVVQQSAAKQQQQQQQQQQQAAKPAARGAGPKPQQQQGGGAKPKNQEAQAAPAAPAAGSENQSSTKKGRGGKAKGPDGAAKPSAEGGAAKPAAPAAPAPAPESDRGEAPSLRAKLANKGKTVPNAAPAARGGRGGAAAARGAPKAAPKSNAPAAAPKEAAPKADAAPPAAAPAPAPAAAPAAAKETAAAASNAMAAISTAAAAAAPAAAAAAAAEAAK